MKRKTETHALVRNGRQAIQQLAAGVRWMVRSWLKPADREARWEQNQRGGCPGEKR